MKIKYEVESNEYPIQILKNEHIRLLAEEPFSKYITELERAIYKLRVRERNNGKPA